MIAIVAKTADIHIETQMLIVMKKKSHHCRVRLCGRIEVTWRDHCQKAK